MIQAIVIAGGRGSRMGADIPKQFLHIEGKPVLIYTLEAFQRHPMVDGIVVVCIDGWQEVVREYAGQYGVTKLKSVVVGGATGQESIRNGVFSLEGTCQENDIVLIHDGIRPLVDSAVLDDVIRKAQQYGSGVTAVPYTEQIFLVDESNPDVTRRFVPRETIRCVATPQAYRFGLIDEAYHHAFERGVGIHGASYANTMMVELGYTLHLAAGSDRNLKLTTPADLDVFKAYLAREMALKRECQ